MLTSPLIFWIRIQYDPRVLSYHMSDKMVWLNISRTLQHFNHILVTSWWFKSFHDNICICYSVQWIFLPALFSLLFLPINWCIYGWASYLVTYIHWRTSVASRWRQNERDGFKHHRRLDRLLNRLLSRRSKKNLKLRVTGFCEEN